MGSSGRTVLLVILDYFGVITNIRLLLVWLVGWLLDNTGHIMADRLFGLPQRSSGSSSGSGITQNTSGVNTGDWGSGKQTSNKSGGGDQGNGGLPDDGSMEALEASFKEFCERPENKPMMVKHEKKEAKKAARLNRKMQAFEFKEKVLESSYEAQKNIAPFLENRVLRRIVQTFTNDKYNDFDKWARNPIVLNMLKQAHEALNEGRLTDEEVENNILEWLKDPTNPSHDMWKHKTKQTVRLSTDQLVSALNEQVQLRRKGNDLYKARRFVEALKEYESALGICNFINALSSPDQFEVDTNKQACLLNVAAVRMAMSEYGAAEKLCTEALELDSMNIKALLRRAKARMGRGSFAEAREDLNRVKELEPWNWEAEEQLRRLRDGAKESLRRESQLAAEMLA